MTNNLYVCFFKFHKRMSTLEKVSFWGSLASIVGLAVALTSTPAASVETQVVSGNNNTVVGENHGSININNGNSIAQKRYVLRNRSTGVTLMLSEPNLDAAFEAHKHVCNVIAGMDIRLTGRNTDRFKEIEVLSGECAGKYGWVVAENISFE